MKLMSKYLSILLLPSFIFSCGGGDEQSVGGNGKPSLAKSDEQLIQAASEKMISEFHNNLKMELGKALNEGGPSNAINVCADIAPEISASHSKNGWSIKRVSDKNRNPGNKATPAQMVFLNMFAGSRSAIFWIYVLSSLRCRVFAFSLREKAG